MADTPTEQKPNLIDEAKAAAERLEKANAQAEEIEAKKVLSGRSQPGAAPVEKSPKEKIKEGAMEMFKGTPIEKAIRKHG